MNPQQQIELLLSLGYVVVIRPTTQGYEVTISRDLRNEWTYRGIGLTQCLQQIPFDRISQI